jgi:hypothetical protein
MHRKVKKLDVVNPGHISVLALLLVILFAFLLVALGEVCRIFIIREITKKTSDAISLAVSQDILFFNTREARNTAQVIAEQNSCKLVDLVITYDEVFVTVEKKLDFIILRSIYPGGCMISSSSHSEVKFPWDESFGFCNSYEFNY